PASVAATTGTAGGAAAAAVGCAESEAGVGGAGEAAPGVGCAALPADSGAGVAFSGALLQPTTVVAPRTASAAAIASKESFGESFGVFMRSMVAPLAPSTLVALRGTPPRISRDARGLSR